MQDASGSAEVLIGDNVDLSQGNRYYFKTIAIAADGSADANRSVSFDIFTIQPAIVTQTQIQTQFQTNTVYISPSVRSTSSEPTPAVSTSIISTTTSVSQDHANDAAQTGPATETITPKKNGMSENTKVGVGVGIGLGIPLIALLAAGAWLSTRRRRGPIREPEPIAVMNQGMVETHH